MIGPRASSTTRAAAMVISITRPQERQYCQAARQEPVMASPVSGTIDSSTPKATTTFSQ
jgi:hypothetical protein